MANMINREVYLKEELATKKENIASIATSLENNNKEIAELHKQIDEMRATNVNNLSLIGVLSRLVAEQEIQLKDLKEVIGTKEKVIVSFAASLENSKMENAELHKQLAAMKVTNENNRSLIGEYKEKIDSLSGLVVEREVQLKDLNEVLAERRFKRATIGISMSYLLGNKLGTPFLRKFGPKLHLTEKRINTTRKLFDSFSPYILFIGYFIPGVRHITAYLAGINCLPYKKFALFTYSGAVLWGFTFVTSLLTLRN